MTDRRGFFRKLLALPLIPFLPLAGKGAGGIDRRWLKALEAPLRHAVYGKSSLERIYTSWNLEQEMGETVIDPNIDPIPDLEVDPTPDAEVTFGPRHRIFQATKQVGFGDDVVPGGYIKGRHGEAKMTSFGPVACYMGQLEVYQVNPPAPLASHSYIADIHGIRHAV